MAHWRLPLIAALALLAACGKDEITSYKIPKESETALPLAPASAPAAAGTATAGTLTWAVPAGWQREAAAGMRFASFSVPAAGGKCELSVVTLPGDAGGMLANVNRWRGQLGAAPISETEIGTTRIATPAGQAVVVEIKGEGGHAGEAMSGAILSSEDSTWFFKLTGKAGAVAAARPSFLAFLKSLRAGPRS